MTLWMKDPKTKEKSVTLTFFAIGFIFALFKLIFSKIAFGGFTMPEFSGLDFAAVTAALGGVYTLRRANDDPTKPAA